VLPSRYIRLTEAVPSAVTASHIPLYSCNNSKKTYTQHQLLVLLLLKENLGLDYRSFVDLLVIMDTIRELLRLDRIPYYTTLHKFLQRILSLWLTRIRKRMLSTTYQRGDVITVTALDSSGFTSAYASSYYSEKTGKTRKRFLKVSLAVDTETQMILASAITQHPTHGAALAGHLLNQSHRTRKTAWYVMDKRYDAEWIRRLIREDLNANSLISVRKRKQRKIQGKYRRELARSFDKEKYPRRNIAETTFSVLKRTLGENLKARKYRCQVKEILQYQKNDHARTSIARDRAFLQSHYYKDAEDNQTITAFICSRICRIFPPTWVRESASRVSSRDERSQSGKTDLHYRNSTMQECLVRFTPSGLQISPYTGCSARQRGNVHQNRPSRSIHFMCSGETESRITPTTSWRIRVSVKNIQR